MPITAIPFLPFAPMPPERVADSVLTALLQCKRVAVMGRSNRLIGWIDRRSPRAADLLRIRRVGHLLLDAFSSKASGPSG